MIIKKYKALTEKEAILLAKEDLGPDAIVMNVKKSSREESCVSLKSRAWS